MGGNCECIAVSETNMANLIFSLLQNGFHFREPVLNSQQTLKIDLPCLPDRVK